MLPVLRMIMKIVSARGPTPPILKCYLVSVRKEKSIFLTRPTLVFPAGYNFREGGVGPLADTISIIVRWQHLPPNQRAYHY